jgi:WD repeat-containing protein 68
MLASPHDAHLLATFSQDSNLIRILDVRQPGQALLELRGHAASINCIEWSPTRRGMLASGGDDSMVLVWDLLNQNSATFGATIGANGSQPGQPALGSGAGTGPGAGTDIGRGPTASWRCDYEVGNLSWAPQSALTSHSGDWLGVTGGRGLWGVKL